MKRFTMRTVWVCALILALLCGAALAAVSGSVFDMSMRGQPAEYLQVQPSAAELVRQDLGKIEGERFTLCAEEAIYDGQELRVVVSVTDKTGALTAETAFSDAQSEYPELTEAFHNALHADGFALHDGLDIGGIYANPYETAAQPGGEAGQVLLYTRCNPYLDNSGADPKGEFTVTLPFWRFDTDDTEVRAERAIQFTLNADDAAKHIMAAKAEPVTLASGATVSLEWGKFSPLLGFVTLRVEKPDVTADTFWEDIEGDEELMQWIYDLQATTPDGTSLLTMGEGWGPMADKPETACVQLRIIPPDEWPDTLTLSAGEGSAAMTLTLGE